MDRYEDDIIAWLWRVYIETKGNDPFILPYLPMTKVRKVNNKSDFICFLKAVYNAIEITLHFLRVKEIQLPVGFIISGVSKVNHSVRKLFVNLLLIIYF
jgi:hypothetical protein